MKAEELMIGDWVMVEQRKCKVCDVHSYDIEVDIYSRGRFEDEDIKPIPITDEILKKNGFGCAATLFQWVDNIYIISILNWGTDEWDVAISKGRSIPLVKIEIKYVHQLQHALKLCGINKNIKV